MSTPHLSQADPLADRSSLNTRLDNMLKSTQGLLLNEGSTQAIEARFSTFTQGLDFDFEEQAPSVATLQAYLKDELGNTILAQSKALSSAVGLRWVSLSAEQDHELQLALENGLATLKDYPSKPNAAAN